MCKAIILAAAFATATLAPASADVVISTDATQNMSCSTGVCAPTATEAVLNVTDLENLLAAGNVSVVTTNGGIQADNIAITAAFSWKVASSLTLDAYQSIAFSAVVQNKATGNVSLTTNDGGTGGALTFAIGTGKLDTNAVSINGETYTMAASVKKLAERIVRKPKGHFALSNDTDAGKDGLYYISPIPLPFKGAFNGLGHTISNLEIVDQSDDNVGLFAVVNKGASLASVSLQKALVDAGVIGGALVGLSYGTIANVLTNGRVRGVAAGGIAGQSYGTITLSQSAATVNGSVEAGGITGGNYKRISLSFATGKVSGKGEVGGLVGSGGHSKIENSYALGVVVGGSQASFVGGFIGYNYKSSIAASYSTGAVSGPSSSEIGGFDGADHGTITNGYWDTDTSGQSQGSGDGNEAGLTGLTTQQFQSGLPAGFDPSIWAEDANINNGFPYLIANPPPK